SATVLRRRARPRLPTRGNAWGKQNAISTQAASESAASSRGTFGERRNALRISGWEMKSATQAGLAAGPAAGTTDWEDAAGREPPVCVWWAAPCSQASAGKLLRAGGLCGVGG